VPKTWRWAGRPAACWGRDRRHGLRQTTNPFQDLSVLRGQPALEHLPGLTVQPARRHRSCVHNIQPNTSFRCGCHCTTTRVIVNSQLSTDLC